MEDADKDVLEEVVMIAAGVTVLVEVGVVDVDVDVDVAAGAALMTVSHG